MTEVSFTCPRAKSPYHPCVVHHGRFAATHDANTDDAICIFCGVDIAEELKDVVARYVEVTRRMPTPDNQREKPTRDAGVVSDAGNASPEPDAPVDGGYLFVEGWAVTWDGGVVACTGVMVPESGEVIAVGLRDTLTAGVSFFTTHEAATRAAVASLDRHIDDLHARRRQLFVVPADERGSGA